MTDKTVLKIRIIVASATFIALLGTLIQFFENWSLNSNSIFMFLLLLLSFATLAVGVSYLSEILNKNRNYLRVITGFLSIIVFTFVLFPALNNKSENYIFWAWLITFYLDAILISLSSLLELFHDHSILKVFSFVFALNSAIFFIFISSMIFRDESIDQGGIGILFYGAILFLICMIVNLIAISSSKSKIRG